MRSLFYKQKKLRTKFFYNEHKMISRKFIFFNPILEKEKSIQLGLHFFNNFFNFFRSNSIVKMTRFCIYTYRSRGVLRKFKISRLLFRRLASLGFILGLRKK